MFIYSFLNFLALVRYITLNLIVWLVLCAISCVILYNIVGVVKRAIKGHRIWLNVVEILCVGLIFVVWGNVLLNFNRTHVYVPENVTALVISSDGGVQDLGGKGLHKTQRFEDLILWLEMEKATIRVNGRPNTSSTGTIVVFDIDLRDVDRVSFYNVFGCQTDLCVIKVVSQKIQDTYFNDGCKAISEAMKRFVKYGLNGIQITYCD